MVNPLEIKVVPVLCCSVFCCVFIFAIIALPLSFKSLEQGKYALKLNWSTQKLHSDVMTEPGMYMTGLGNMLVEFPSTFQTMYFVRNSRGISEASGEDEVTSHIMRGVIRARSADGLEMHVAVSFQWQLKEGSLLPLYALLGGGELEESLYRDEFVRFARAAVVQSCANWEAEKFFTHRVEITADMLSILRKAFDTPPCTEMEQVAANDMVGSEGRMLPRANCGLSMTIQGLQLREVDLPDAYDEEIIHTQEEMQEVEVRLAEREEQKVMMQKKLMEATEKVKQIIQESIGVAEKTRIENEAVVEQLLNLQRKQAAANAEILAQFVNDTDPFARLFEIMEIRALNAHKGERLMINM